MYASALMPFFMAVFTLHEMYNFQHYNVLLQNFFTSLPYSHCTLPHYNIHLFNTVIFTRSYSAHNLSQLNVIHNYISMLQIFLFSIILIISNVQFITSAQYNLSFTPFLPYQITPKRLEAPMIKSVVTRLYTISKRRRLIFCTSYGSM